MGIVVVVVVVVLTSNSNSTNTYCVSKSNQTFNDKEERKNTEEAATVTAKQNANTHRVRV